MISSVLILLLAAAITRFWLRPPRGLRLVAWVNFVFFAVISYGFSQFTGSALAGVDALKFYRLGTQKDLSGVETVAQADFMYMISGTLQRLVPLDYTAFNLIGAMLFAYVGLLFALRLNPNPSGRLKLVWWVVTLLPGLHFWNASFGKDSLQILAIGAYFYFRSLPLKGGALLVLLLVRPHIAVVLGLAEAIANLFEKGASLRKVVILGASLGVVAVAVNFLVGRLGGNEVSFASLMSLFSDYGEEWQEGALRNSDTSSPLAVVEFLLRPYPWEVANLSGMMAFFDSFVLTLVGAIVIFRAPFGVKLSTGWLFSALVLLLLAFTNPNPGTALRKKQLLPFTTGIVAAAIGAPRRRRKTIPSDRPAVQEVSNV